MNTPERRVSRGLYWPLLPLILLAACGTYSTIQLDHDVAPAVRYARTGNLRREVDELAQPLIDKKLTPGLVVGVLLPDGDRKIFGYGVTDRDCGRRPDGDTLFAIGSVSKIFLGAVAAILVQDGRLSWDDTLEQWLPEHIPLSPAAGKITLLQLATHTSGLPRQPYTARLGFSFIRFLFTGENFYRHLDRDYILGYLVRFRAPESPKAVYSNIGYAYLGYVLELCTGQALDALMREELLGPLRLDATGYDPRRLPGSTGRARGYAGDQPKFMSRRRPVPEWDFPPIMRGSAGLYSTADDLLTYAGAHLRSSGDERLDRALRDTLRVRFRSSGQGRAITWVVERVDYCEITYQIGFVSGYSCYIGMDIANRTAVVVLQNCLNWTESIGQRLLLRMAYALQLH